MKRILRPTAFVVVVSICAASVCVKQSTFPHVALSGPVRVPVTVRSPCRPKRNAKLPALMMLNGGSVRSTAYRELCTALARRGFVVYIASYTSRAPPGGPLLLPPACPKNGTLVSVSMVYSLSKFAARNPSVDVNTGVVFGHSYGGVVGSSALFDEDCRQRQGFQDFFCDGATIRKPLPLNIQLWAMFEGGADQPYVIPHSMLVVYMYSPFSKVEATTLPGGFRGRLRNLTVGGRANLVEVAYTNVTNHLGPNDFEPEFLHAKTLCSATRPPAQQSFKTTRQRQSDVIRSIADVTSMSYYYFKGRGAKSLPELVKKIPALPFVMTAHTLADLDKKSGKVLKQ